MRYLEHHLKLLLGPETDYEVLARTAEQCASHLSTNAQWLRSDGRQERFVTQRYHGMGRIKARRRMAPLLQGMAPAEQVLAVEEDYVAYDSNTAVDGAWLGGDA